MTPCSRCGSRHPEPDCYVCWEDKASRDADYGDYLRDEMIDRQMEEEREEKKGNNER
jgi:hypothetical protein